MHIYIYRRDKIEKPGDRLTFARRSGRACDSGLARLARDSRRPGLAAAFFALLALEAARTPTSLGADWSKWAGQT